MHPTVRFLPPSDAAAARETWRALEERTGNRTIACSWDWTESWLHAFGDAVPHRFAVAHARRGGPVGIALVTEEPDRRVGPVRVRRAYIGTAGEDPADSAVVEYNRLLAEPGWAEGFARALRGALLRQGWEEIALEGFTARDAQPFLAGVAHTLQREEPCPLTTLSASGPELLDTLPSGTRRRIARSMRGFGEIETEWAETPERALDILDELIELHQARWSEAGESGSFASRRFTAFHRELLPRLAADGRAMAFRGRADGRTVGCLYSLLEDGRVLFYQSGLARFDDNKLKPGVTLHALCMEECRRRGFREYNFLAGESRYKRELANGEDRLTWTVVRRRSAKQRALEGARAARRLVPGRRGG